MAQSAHRKNVPRYTLFLILCCFIFAALSVAQAAVVKAPIPYLERSRATALQLTREIGSIHPEFASEQGLSEFHPRVTIWSLGTRNQYLQLILEWKARLTSLAQSESDPDMKIDFEILQNFLQNQINEIRLTANHLQFFKGSEAIYENLHSVKTMSNSPQTIAQVRGRFLNYVYGQTSPEQGTLLAWKTMTQRRLGERADLIWPTRLEVENYLRNSKTYLDGINEIFESRDVVLTGAIEVFALQLQDYDDFIRNEILPRARQTNTLSRELYEHQLRTNGVTWSSEELERRALDDYRKLLPELQELAEKIGMKYGLPPQERTPFFVSQHLRRGGISGAQELLAFTRNIAEELQRIVQQNDLVTLPDWPVNLRQSNEAENAASPFPHVRPAPPLAQDSRRPEYVFPINSDGTAVDEDSHYRAAAMTLTAHEARPGHELQLAHIMDQGSRTRAAYGMVNSVVEGWAMYVEHLLMQYYDDEARYGALQSILFRVARAFLDPMVQRGAADEAAVIQVMVQEVGISEAFARSDYSRYVWRMPGQATSYYFGLRSLLDIKQQVMAEQGPLFRERRFNDAVVRAGFVPFESLKVVLDRAFALPLSCQEVFR